MYVRAGSSLGWLQYLVAKAGKLRLWSEKATGHLNNGRSAWTFPTEKSKLHKVEETKVKHILLQYTKTVPF